jgi:hypothetical protein
MCQQYNDSLNQFFERTGHWVRESERVQNWYRRSAVLELLLHNSGGAPGTDIDLEMTFPPHLEIVAPGQMPTIPAEPLLPLRPNDRSRAALVASQPYVPEEFRIESVSLSGKSRISRMEDTTDGTLVTVHLNDLKHTYDTDIPRLLVHFQSYEEAGSFRFRYRIVAANHPKPTEGSLDVVVEK